MVKRRSETFRIKNGHGPIQDVHQSIESNEKSVLDITTPTYEKIQYNQNDINNPSIVVNSRILKLNITGLEKVCNADLNCSNKPMLIENYAKVLIRNNRLSNSNSNNRLSYYLQYSI